MKIKRTLLLMSLALASTALITGCKKDNREKIDLSGIHTTAAPAETMAPEPETTAASPAAASTEAPSTTEAATTGKKPGSATVPNISTKINVYKNGNLSIEYPSVIHLSDAKKTAALDELLKNNACSVITAYNLDPAQSSLDIKCKVLSADRNRITVTYTGILTQKDAPYPVNIFYSNTIDTGKVTNIGFSKLVDPYTMAGYVLSGDCEFHQAPADLTAELMKVKNETSIEQYTDWFTHADFPFEGKFPVSFSYEHEGTVFFSIPVPHALGDYALVKYTPDTK